MNDCLTITSVAAYRALDEGEVLEGYLDGVSGGRQPGSDRSCSYWHGWLNGRTDAGLRPRDADQEALDEAFAALAI